MTESRHSNSLAATGDICPINYFGLQTCEILRILASYRKYQGLNDCKRRGFTCKKLESSKI